MATVNHGNRQMLVIGIAGGVAAGKSLVADQLKQLGAAVLDGDAAGHATLDEPDVRQAIRDRWGQAVFDDNGHVRRSALAKIVFGPTNTGPPPAGPIELEHLEEITHPSIRARLEQQIVELENQATRAAVLDAAVMFKAGWDHFCDKIVFVDAPRSERLRRAVCRGWDADEFDRRESAQLSIEEKRTRADVVIDNSGPPEKTQQQVEEFWNTHVVAR